jgi:hypothetical protein
VKDNRKSLLERYLTYGSDKYKDDKENNITAIADMSRACYGTGT